VDLDVEAHRPPVHQKGSAVILLDTNAIIWLVGGDSRAAPLAARGARLYASPASQLELQFLSESGRLRVRGGASVAQLVHDERWAPTIRPPPPGSKAIAVGWTRDPFDRLPWPTRACGNGGRDRRCCAHRASRSGGSRRALAESSPLSLSIKRAGERVRRQRYASEVMNGQSDSAVLPGKALGRIQGP
jgi:PIN domain nuclease of toxin-antitoxin system